MFLGQALILGIIQGVTELLPISSSGHLILIPYLFNWPDQGLAFDGFIHLGTLVAVILYFRKEIFLIGASFFKPEKSTRAWRRLGIFVLFATVPAGIAGILFQDAIGTYFRSSTVVAVSLIVWGLVLWAAEEYNRRAGRSERKLEHTGFWQSFSIGLWQVIALIPGTSRSGITITGGLLVGLDRKRAVAFSFLLSIPIIFAAGIVSLKGVLSAPRADLLFPLVGFVAALVSGYAALSFLMGVIVKWGFRPFVIYRILLGLVILFFL